MDTNENKSCFKCKHEFIPLEFFEFRYIDGIGCHLCLFCDANHTERVRQTSDTCFTCKRHLEAMHERYVNIDSNVLCVVCWSEEEDIGSSDSGFSTPDSETSEDFSSLSSDDEA